MVKSVLLCLLLAFCLVNGGGVITSIVLDKPAGQIYAIEGDFENNYLHELDQISLQENNIKHLLPQNFGALEGTSSFVKAQNGHRYLYLFVQDNINIDIYLFQIKVPFGNNPNVVVHANVSIFGYIGEQPVFDGTDNIALVHAATEHAGGISVIDLSTVSVSEFGPYQFGHKKIWSAFVYNHQTDRALFFDTQTPSYYLEGHEIAIVDNTIVDLDTNFTNADPANGPFKKAVLTSGAIDYRHNKVWFLNAGTGLQAGQASVVSFNVSDLNDYRFIPLPDAIIQLGNHATFNFVDQVAYVVTDPYDSTDFTVYEVDLLHYQIHRSQTYQFVSDSTFITTVYLDVDQGNLFIGFGPGQFVPAPAETYLGVIDTGALSYTLLTLS